MALFRLIEPASGSIYVDGINISVIGLHALRSKLSVIPQEPTLFTGTIRENLDPFNVHSDQEIWAAMQSAHLGLFVQMLPQKLETIVAPGMLSACTIALHYGSVVLAFPNEY